MDKSLNRIKDVLEGKDVKPTRLAEKLGKSFYKETSIFVISAACLGVLKY